METIFFEITVIICIASLLSIVFRMLKQPAIVAYIVTGVLIGPLGIFPLKGVEALQTLSQLGITLLLFMLGLELKFKELKSIGKTAVLAGLLQVWFTFFGGFWVARFLGFENLTAIYIGIATAFSSTIIIVKLLSDKKDLTSLHGKIAIGILLVQDFLAVLTLIFLSKNATPAHIDIAQIALIFPKIILLFGLIIYLSRNVFPHITKMIAKSHESLFLFSLAWVFALTAFVSSPFIGFSVEIGGFLAGLALANSHENFQIIAKMRALRDFFITIFFVLLGIEMQFTNISSVIVSAVILSIFVLLVKPLIAMAVVSVIGYKKRTAFFVGVSLGQISEFSLIILFLGRRIGVIQPEAVTLVLFVSIITFIFSTYMMQHTSKLYARMGRYLSLLEQKHPYLENNLSTEELTDLEDHIVVVGGEQMGQSILKALESSGERVVVVDFNPDIITRLKAEKTLSMFGDITDVEIQERIGLRNSKLVVSTVPDLEDNLLLLQAVKQLNKKAVIVVMSLDGDDAKALYKAGADYVVLPQLAGGRHLAKILVDKNHLELIEEYKEKDLAQLA